MTEYTVHFRARGRTRMVTVEAQTPQMAVKLARVQFIDKAFKVVRVDHFEGLNLVIDY